MKRILLFALSIGLVPTACEKGNEPTPPPQDGKVYKVRDYFPDPDVTFNDDGTVATGEEPEGIVFWIDPASSTDGGASGTHGKVIGLKESVVMAYHLATYVDYGAGSLDDGAANTAAIDEFVEQNPEYEGAFPIFHWCRDTYGEPWFLPALQEWRLFNAVYCELTPEVAAEYLNAYSYFLVVPMPWEELIASGAWDRFNALITAAGGQPLDWPQYWSSTQSEFSGWIPWYIDIGGGRGASGTGQAKDGHPVRAMRAF